MEKFVLEFFVSCYLPIEHKMNFIVYTIRSNIAFFSAVGVARSERRSERRERRSR